MRADGHNRNRQWINVCHKARDDPAETPTPLVGLHLIASCDQCAKATNGTDLCLAPQRNDLMVGYGCESRSLEAELRSNSTYFGSPNRG